MPQFTDSQITVWGQNYEREICSKYPLIADRWSLQIISGDSTYELPNYINNIRSVLYMGKELHPKGFSASRMTNDTPFQTAGSIPYEYLMSGKGQRTIKLYPTPMDNIAVYVPADPNIGLWSPAAEEVACIVEFYRSPNYGSDPPLVLPWWLRRYLLKDYICYRTFNAEGPQQDLRASKYYQGRMSEQDEYLKRICRNMNQAQVNILFEQKVGPRRGPGRPVLPPNFGFPINGGY